METVGQVCIINIGPRERRRRRRSGIVALGVAAAAAILLIASGVAPAWRLVLLVPFWAGALGVFQALDKT